MTYILILLFIPIFFVGIVIYLTTLYTYAFGNELDVVLLLIGLFSSLISSFVVLKTYALMDLRNYKLVKLQNKVDAIVNIFSFTLLFLFGVTLIINSIINTMNIGKFMIGMALVIFYTYVFYYSLLSRTTVDFKLIDITKATDKVYRLSLENEKLGVKEVYVKDKDMYKKGESYKCLYSTVFNDITKIKTK